MDSTPTPSSSYETLITDIDQLDNRICLVKMEFTKIHAVLKDLKKQVQKLSIKHEKLVEKHARNQRSRSASGFARPVPTTPELCAFMSVAEGTLIARTTATKAIIAYIKAHQLESPQSKKHIIPDETLTRLFGLHSDEASQLTYFNIQKYVNRLFVN